MHESLNALDRRIDERFGTARWPQRATCGELEGEIELVRKVCEVNDEQVAVFWESLRTFADAGRFTVDEAERALHSVTSALRLGASTMLFEQMLGGEFLSDIGPRVLRFAENLAAALAPMSASERDRHLARWEAWLQAPPEAMELDFDGLFETMADPAAPPPV